MVTERGGWREWRAARLQREKEKDGVKVTGYTFKEGNQNISRMVAERAEREIDRDKER